MKIGRRPEAALVAFRTAEALRPLSRRDHLGLAEAYLCGQIELTGDFGEVLKLTEVIAPDPTWLERLGLALRLFFRSRRKLQRGSISRRPRLPR